MTQHRAILPRAEGKGISTEEDQGMSSETTALPPASWTGRVLKLVIGALQLWGVTQIVVFFPSLLEASWNPTIWLFVVLAFWLLPFAIGLGFDRVRAVGRAPLWIALGTGIALALASWTLRGEAWGTPLAAYLLAVTVYVHLHVGSSHVLAAIVGIPGCEMRVIPYLVTRLSRGSSTESFHPCPGWWTPLDRWEAGLRGSRE